MVLWRIQYKGGDEAVGKGRPVPPMRQRGVLCIRVEGGVGTIRHLRDYYYFCEVIEDWCISDNGNEMLEKAIDGVMIFKGGMASNFEYTTSRDRAQTEPIEAPGGGV